MIDLETSQAIQRQMLDKMYMYRSLLSDILEYIEGTNRVTASQIQFTIRRELQKNPEYEVLENLPCIDIPPPNAYKIITNEPND